MDTFTNEIDLLNASLSGNKEAFGTLVENYQSLVCSITYSATGDFAKSEELAQETFIRAWKELKQLKDLGKFRAWLCTITRNLLRQSIRQQQKDVIDTAQPIETAAASETSQTQPDQIAISKEQQTVIWQALQEIPETYREPMVLFYREQQSLKQVATQLDLSEEVTKQRLSRGRKLLKAEMSTLVEDILSQTTPNKVFTAGVIAALPVFSTKAASIAVAGATAKGANAFALGTILNFLGILVTPILVWWGAINLHKGNLESANSDMEREFIKRSQKIGLLYCTLGLLLIFTLPRYGVSIILSVPLFMIGIIVLGTSNYRKLKAIQIEEGTYIEPEKRIKPKRLVYGEFSVVTFNWLMIINYMPFMAKDWFAVWFSIFGAIVIFIIATRVYLKYRQLYNQIHYATFGTVGILALLIYNLRWHKWVIEVPKFEKFHLWQINLLIIAATSGLILLTTSIEYSKKYRKNRQSKTN